MKGAWKTNETFERDRCLWLWDVIAITIIITIYSVQSYKRLRDKKLLAKSLMLTAIPLVLMLTAIGIYRFCK